ncbi:MAG TPA: OsmC family protein [Bacteroidia bacterium]|nr:OsmC family protein [Bacteroidia bacterium]
MKFEKPIVVTNAGELYSTTVDTGRVRFVGDEPAEKGGKDAGPTAHQLFLASLGTCTAITLRMYAGRKEWDLQKVTISLNMEKVVTEGVEKTIIYKKIALEGNLDEGQRSRLLFIADKCPVHKTMSGPIEIKELA